VYAKIGGIPVKELNALELEFLYLLKYNLFVTSEVFEMYHSKLSAFFSKRSVTHSKNSNSSATEEEIKMISNDKKTFKHVIEGSSTESRGTVFQEAF